MKKLILCVGAAAFALGTPALAQQGKGNAKHGKAQSAQSHGKAHSNANSKAHSKAHSKARSKGHGKHVVTMRNGSRLYAFDARGSCPPGLAKKNNGCMPPGQAKKQFNVGQRYNSNFGNVWTYNQIPSDLRSRYQFDQAGRYYYRDGYLYQVNPRTMLVQQVVSALLR